ncbi:porin [Rhodoferax sp.]|uniref:porin n=1 Tax=Rhodoferax sp. TaxID=50421 RepID=UPI00261BA1D5|nr:porin [Rhodoferax sp.]MDD4944365.1 porin [Rhodoferax sp.]MDD5478954.1 porin [Rhodoferax sp.]
MKKSLIAMAVLAASGAAMAQSSVTLYGIADVWVGSISTKTAGVTTRTTEMVSGGVSSSRWGMRGSEDLGGGLKANFQLEQGFNMDDGAGTGFTRAANVGFSGGFGAVKFGVAGTAFDDAQARSASLFDSDLAPANGFTMASGLKNAGAVFRSVQHAGKATNQIHYQAPNMSGLSGAVSYALAEDANGLPAGAKATTAFNLTYSGGPLGAELAYQKEDLNNNANDVAYTRLGGAYDFGVAKAKLQYGKVSNVANVSGADTTEFAIGADIPVSANMTLGVGYAKSSDNVTAGDQKRSSYGLAVAYGLSKRTTVYGGLKMMTYDNPGLVADTDVSAVAFGVKHTF